MKNEFNGFTLTAIQEVIPSICGYFYTKEHALEAKALAEKNHPNQSFILESVYIRPERHQKIGLYDYWQRPPLKMKTLQELKNYFNR